MGREEVTWQLQTKERNEVSDIRGSCPILDDKRRLCRGLISREGQRGRPQGRRPERGPCALMPDPAGSTRDPLTEGASEGGPRLSAPTDPCLPQCVLPCLSPEAKHPGPEPADHLPGPTEMLPGGRYSPRRARGGSTARVKQPPLPANTPCPRRAALQRPGQMLRPPALPPAFQRMLTHARAHTHTHAHTHTVHARTHTHTRACTHTHTHTGCWDPRACNRHTFPCGTPPHHTTVFGGCSSSAPILQRPSEAWHCSRRGGGPCRGRLLGFPRGQLPVSRR